MRYTTIFLIVLLLSTIAVAFVKCSVDENRAKREAERAEQCRELDNPVC